jgi:hypothetical protein
MPVVRKLDRDLWEVRSTLPNAIASDGDVWPTQVVGFVKGKSAIQIARQRHNFTGESSGHVTVQSPGRGCSRDVVDGSASGVVPYGPDSSLKPGMSVVRIMTPPFNYG